MRTAGLRWRTCRPGLGTGQAVDQIALSSGVNTLSGNVPAGYTLTTLAGATLEPTVTLTSNGAIVLNSGQLLDNTASTAFTNAGTFDVPADTYGIVAQRLELPNSPTGPERRGDARASAAPSTAP